MAGSGSDALLNGLHRVLDRVLDALQLDAVVLDDGVGGARVAVARLADAAGVDDQLVADLQHVGVVRVADADDVGLDVLQPPRPELDVGRGVLVERVARRGVDQQEARVVQRDRAASPAAGRGSGGRRRETRSRVSGRVTPVRYLKPLPPLTRDVLGDAVVVIAADGVRGVLAHPVDARRRLQAVIDQVAQEQADVVRLRRWPAGPASWRGCRPAAGCAWRPVPRKRTGRT